MTNEIFIRNQLQLFKEGIKPCAFYSEKRENYRKLEKLNYPSIVVFIEGFKNKLFFQNENAKEQFLKINRLKTEVIFNLDHAIIGKALGFPEEAYKSFPVRHENRACIDYHGFTFTCHKKNIQKCLDYMEKTYSIPEQLQCGIKISFRENGKWVEQKELA